MRHTPTIGKGSTIRPRTSTGLTRIDPPRRLPSARAGSTQRTKAPAFGTSAGRRDGHRAGSSRGNREPSLSLTYGRHGDNFSGFVTLDRRGGDTRLHGSVIHHPDHHGRYGYRGIYARPYPYAATYPYRYSYPRYYRDCSSDRYYRGYRPLYFHDGYPRHYPRHGYSYTSYYHYDPVVYRYVDVYNVYTDVADDYTDDPDVHVHVYGADEVAVDRAYGYAPGRAAERPSEPADLVGPPAVLAEPDPSLDTEPTLVGEGVQAFRDGHYEEARSSFVRAILADERDGYAKLLYGLASFATGEYSVAAVSMRRALRTSDLLIDRPPDLRFLYDDETMFSRQLDALSRIASEQPSNRDVQFVMAYVLYATGEADSAVVLFARLADADPADELAGWLADAAREKASLMSRD